eukprot:CAMPEP_0198671512 /NCGR_PEP_ID=MMETSP1467-20131203/86464_1 /TAXON_ID=1462469 /ORGANISM="unid. sp., Strain CCMP2135" /LENGTH=348 /DNA_ID=CAMNT_0044408313 /DNA_START=90 /DNA_END=1133 /DNA_ORIENTATION=-
MATVVVSDAAPLIASAALVVVGLRVVRRMPRELWVVVPVVAAMYAKPLFHGMLRLASTGEVAAVLAKPTRGELEVSYRGKTALCVGGTRGIGRGIAEALRHVGARPSVVGRTGTTNGTTFAFDLSSVRGCHRLGDALKADGTRYDAVFFTVGAWPDSRKPRTADGVERVVALDLLARHVVLTRLVHDKLLKDDAVVVNVLASAQNFPGLSAVVVKRRLVDSVKKDVPPPGLVSSLGTVAVAADAYLQAAARRFPRVTFVGTHPGLVATDLPSSYFPPWFLPVFHALITPFADDALDVGFLHLALAASSRRFFAGNVSYWNHLLEARPTHPLAYDQDLSEFVWKFLAHR